MGCRGGESYRGLWLAVLLTGLAGCGSPPVADEPDRALTSEQAEEASHTPSHSPRLRWFLHPTAPGQEDSAVAVTMDRDQNTIVLFTFSTSIDLGSGPLTGPGTDHPGVFRRKLAVAKFRPDGRLLWARAFAAVSAGSSSSTILRSRALAVDRRGDIVLVGSTSEPTDFGGGLLPPGNFLLKLDSGRGRHVWSRALPPAAFNAIAVDRQDHISLAGSFSGTMDFGSGPISSKPTPDPDEPESSAFIASYTSEGRFLWVWANVTEPGDVRALTVDSQDHLLAAVTVGSVEGVAIIRVSPTGNLLWDRRPGIHGNPTSIATHGNRVVATGRFLDGFTFAGQPFSTENIDAFVIAYTRSGEERWARTLGIEGTGVAMDQRDGVLITGAFAPGDDLGLGSPRATGGTYVSRLDRISGEVQWVRTLEGGGSNGIAVTRDGRRITVVGVFSGPFDFGAGPLMPENIDPFVVQFGVSLSEPSLFE